MHTHHPHQHPVPPRASLSCAVQNAAVPLSMPCCTGLSGAAGASDIPRAYNTARQYLQIGQLRAPAHVWLPWDVLEDVVSMPNHVLHTLRQSSRDRPLCLTSAGSEPAVLRYTAILYTLTSA